MTRHTRIGRGICAGLLSCSMGAVIGPTRLARAGETQKRVLVLYSVRRDTAIASIGDREIPLLIERGLKAKPDVYSEYIDAARFPDPDYSAAFNRYLNLKYSRSQFDLVIAFHSIAYEFVVSHRNQLFAGTPIVFLSEIRPVDRAVDSAGVFDQVDYRQTLSLALQLQPDTNHVFVIVGSSKRDRVMESTARAQLESAFPNVGFSYSSNLTTEQLEDEVAALPEHSIIYYLLFYQDAAGVNVHPLEYINHLATIANRPMYSWVDSTMNRGVVGGSLIRIQSQVDAVARVAVRVLGGESADAIPLDTPTLATNQVDWRQLQRWHISEARVPPGTLVAFRELTVWDRYKMYILGAFALILAQTALIVGLLVERSRRRRAEEETRKREADLRASYDRIHDLGRRLITAQEAERARIARELHDDIIQQVALLGINVGMIAERGPRRREEVERLAREALDHVHGIAGSMRALSHRLHPVKLRLTGLVPALASLQRELSHPGLAITFSHENVPDALPPDLTLCLFRVVQEALQNALKHSRARQVAVNLRVSHGQLLLTVADNGIGFDVDAKWGTGLGLISIAERLEPFGGSVNVQSSPAAGTRMEVRVPVSFTQASETVAV